MPRQKLRTVITVITVVVYKIVSCGGPEMMYACWSAQAFHRRRARMFETRQLRWLIGRDLISGDLHDVCTSGGELRGLAQAQFSA